jgi:hypothetical protein
LIAVAGPATAKKALLVPPLADGRMPETSVVRSTALKLGAPIALPCSTVTAVPSDPRVAGETPPPPPRTI